MIVLVEEIGRIFFPFFSINEKNYTSPCAIIFILIHVILSIIAAILTVQICLVIKNVHVFHPNMNVIVIAIISQWFELFIAKLLVFPYQLGIITLGDETIEYHNWVTSSTDEIIPVESNKTKIYPLFIYGIFFLHYGFTLVFSVFILTCERACATYFISDYEKKPRSYISISLLFSMHIITLSISFTATFQIIHFTTGIILCSIFIIGAVCIYFFILHFNIRIQKKLEKYDNLNYYSLAIRFQAKENARSLELARKIVLFAALAILSGIFLLSLVVFNMVDVSHVSFIVLLAETSFNLNPLCVIPLGLHSVPAWRDKFVETTPFLKKMRITKTKVESDVTNNVKQSEVYFNQLSEAWK
ncbi:unnamed protein product [Caenorhabditis angaria]|uniref:Serpentine Receptor, class E (Epsilon) n=1 Tax=Caenorhabditis angaria TaxID=860376 RepID=A0A9P1I9T1_9PELO|nr:unnamed protein product [Caenorhabditis angaria]